MAGKDPRRVAAGQARQQQLREQLGEQGYKDYQRERRADAVRKHADLSARGARAANQAQIAAWGEQGYRDQRRSAYAALVEKIGAEKAQKRIRKAHEERRKHRLTHPTAGERTLRAALAEMGFTVRLPKEPFDFLAYRADPQGYDDTITSRTAIAEASVGRFCCDILIPAHRLAIEVYGGVHCLSAAYDAEREARLRGYGLRLIILRSTDDAPLDTHQVREALRREIDLD